MPERVPKFEPTPNPNARRCPVALPSVTGMAMRSYRTAAEAAHDPIATRLFEIPGVAGVLIGAEFVTISRQPKADWAPIVRAARSVLGNAPPQAPP